MSPFCNILTTKQIFSFLPFEKRKDFRTINKTCREGIEWSDPALNIFSIFREAITQNPENTTYALEKVITYVINKKKSSSCFSKIQRIAWAVLTEEIKNEEQLQKLSENSREFVTNSVEFYSLAKKKHIKLHITKEMENLIHYLEKAKEGLFIDLIPKKYRTEEICLASVKKRGWGLGSVPINIITEEICMAAIRQNILALLFVPENLFSKKLCLAALKINKQAKQFIPEKYREELSLQTEKASTSRKRNQNHSSSMPNKRIKK